MKKNLKRSVAWILSLMMVITMCSAAFSVAAEVEGAFDSYTKATDVMYHLGYSNSTDSNDYGHGEHWGTNYRYFAQEFVPSMDVIGGVRLNLLLTEHDAVMEIEIREGSVDGKVIRSASQPFFSIVNGAAWYEFDLEQDVSVTPGNTYYLVYWLSYRNPSTICLAMGGSLDESAGELPVYCKKMGEENAEWQRQNLVSAFEILGANGKNEMLHSFDVTNGVVIPTGNHSGSGDVDGTVWTDNKTEGVASNWSSWYTEEMQPGQTGKLFMGTENVMYRDFTNADYIAFDVYAHGFVSNPDYADLPCLKLGSGTEWHSEDLLSQSVEEMNHLTEGWQTIYVPLTGWNSDKRTDVNIISLRWDGGSAEEGTTAIRFTSTDAYVLFDNLRVLDEYGKVYAEGGTPDPLPDTSPDIPAGIDLPTGAVILDCETGETPDTYIYKARTAPTFEYVDGKGVNGSRALAVTKTGDGQYDNPDIGRIDNCMMYVYGDSVNIGNSKYFMVWLDLSDDIDFRSASLGFSTPDDFGYDPDNNDGRTDIPLYMLPDGSDEWVNANLYDDGCFGTDQLCSVANFRGWLALPLDEMLADADGSVVPANTVVNTLYMFFDFDSLEMEGKTFYIDHACFVEDYKTAFGSSGTPEEPEEPDVAPDWAFVEWTNPDSPITHLGLSTATVNDGDPNWTNYRYVGCQFVPYKNSVSGVKIPMNLTGGNATMHIEIRREINGTALYSGDIDFTSQGDGRYVYTFDFGKDVMVTPGDTYYMVWWLSARDAGSVCIAYGSDIGVGKKVKYGLLWTMSAGDGTGANPVFDIYGNVVFSFELIDANVEGPATYIQWNSFDDGGVSHEAGRTENPTTVTEGQLEGTGAYSITGKADNASNGELFFYLHPDTAYPDRPTVDMSNADYITFDLYCGEEIVSSNILDAGFNVSNSDSWDAGGRACSAATLKEMTWKQGWNHVIIPIDRTLLSESFDETALKRGRFYIIYNGSFAGVTFMIDDLCLIAESDLAACQGRNKAKDVIAAINALPAVDAISFEDGVAIKAALEAFNALEPVYQEMVTNRTTLATVNSAYDSLAAAAIAVQEQIDALPKVAGSSEIFVEDVAAVRMAYTVLPDEKKGFVSNIGVLDNIEKELKDLQDSKVATITAKDMADNVASFGTSYGEMLGWKIDPGQSNNWIVFNLMHTYGPGEYKLGVKVRYTGLTDSRPAISIKCSDNTTGEDEKFKRDCGQADYDAAEKDENGFVTLWLDVNVTESIASHQLEGKVLAYNEFFEDMEIIIAGVYWVNANDTDLVYHSVVYEDFALASTAKVLEGTIVYNDAAPIRIEYEQDDTKDVTDEPGYIFPALSAGNLTAGEYMLDLAYASTSGKDNLFELEIFADGSKVASKIVNENDYVVTPKNSDDIAYLQIPFSLNANSDVTVKVYQMNGGNVSYRTIKIYKTGEGVVVPGDPVEDVINAINALPEASAVSEADRAAIMAAKAAYDALTDEQKAFMSADAIAKLQACIEALPAVSVTMGDVDGDGEINAADALLILKQAVGKIQLSDAQKTAADVTKDGTINAEDALKVLKFAVGKITEL